ncbi:MAG TPA: FtsX-like permease family protein [Anaerolineae bacterium]|nr:FtsX-like permease family protein [Anaerolineae bacterium]
MKLLVKLAYRNLWRNRRRTLLTISAMAVATTLLILTLGIYDGMLWDMVDGATKVYHGHVKITADQYLERRQLHLTIPENGMYEKIRTDSEVQGIAGRVRAFALLSFGEDESGHTQPSELFGIDPAEERNVTTLHEHVSEGRFLNGSDSHEIILGNGLAKLLEAKIGGEVVAMGQASDGSIAADIFQVTGIIDTGDPVRDASLAVVGRKTLQRMFVLEGKLHELSITLKHSPDAKKWASKLQPEFQGMEVTSWNTFLPQIGQIMEAWGAMKFIFAAIFYFAVILVAANTMYMALLERMREFGIMTAIGFKRRRLTRMIILEGSLMSGIAGIAGGLAGMIGSFYLKNHVIDLSAFITQISYAEATLQPRLRSYPTLDNILGPTVMIILLGMIVAIFPARKLRRFRPIDVLREV